MSYVLELTTKMNNGQVTVLCREFETPEEVVEATNKFVDFFNSLKYSEHEYEHLDISYLNEKMTEDSQLYISNIYFGEPNHEVFLEIFTPVEED